MEEMTALIDKLDVFSDWIVVLTFAMVVGTTFDGRRFLIQLWKQWNEKPTPKYHQEAE